MLQVIFLLLILYSRYSYIYGQLLSRNHISNRFDSWITTISPPRLSEVSSEIHLALLKQQNMTVIITTTTFPYVSFTMDLYRFSNLSSLSCFFVVVCDLPSFNV